MKCFSPSVIFIFLVSNANPFCLAAQPPVLVPQKATAAPMPQNLPPVAPAIAPQGGAPSVVPAGQTDSYPLIDQMEIITLGKARPTLVIENRLSDLEQAVFRTSYKNESLFDRTQRLKLAILGPGAGINETQDLIDSASIPPLLNSPLLPMPAHEASGEVTYFELMARDPNNQSEVPRESLSDFALEQINYARSQVGAAPLSLDKLAAKMAAEHVQDLCKRKIVSHTGEKGANPDVRYTAMGGTGAISESLMALKDNQVTDTKYTRALVAHSLKSFIDRQDDRDALLSPDATGFGFAVQLLPGEKKAIACVEISTNHGTMAPIALPLKVGDKIEVKGNIEETYKFFRVSLAWEGLSNGIAGSDESEEALPYFPPLDYTSFAHHTEHDYGAAMTALRMGALVGVIAGSMFMPPVALAAPLIAIAPGPGEAKPMSDIPLHGGVKVAGGSFSGKITLSNSGKSGIYYLTVWATSSKSVKPVPISRRAFMVGDDNNPQPIANAKTQS